MTMASSRMTYRERLMLESFPRQKPLNLVIGEEINRGAYGIVLKGMFGDLPVAVKKIHKVFLEEARSEQEMTQVIEGFRKEADILSSIRNSHIVEFHGGFYDKERREPIILMELMSTDLRTFIEHNKGLPTSNQLQICLQIALGVHFLHHLTPPLAHRDLNDKNVLLAEDGSVKLGDLGQSKHKDMQDIYFGSKAPGNLQFMPPEATSDNPHYTESVDIFSIGVLAVEVTTQSQPSLSIHGIGTVEEVVRRADDLAKMGNSHPLKPLVLKCLQNNYKDRPNIDQVLSELSQLIVENSCLAVKRDVDLLTLTEERDKAQSVKCDLEEQLKGLQAEFQMKLDEEKDIQKEEMKMLQNEKCTILEELRELQSDYEQKQTDIKAKQSEEMQNFKERRESLVKQVRECWADERLDNAKVALNEERVKHLQEKDCLETQLRKCQLEYEQALRNIQDEQAKERQQWTVEKESLEEQVVTLKKDLDEEEVMSRIKTKRHQEEKMKNHKTLDNEKVKRDHVRNELLGLEKTLKFQEIFKRTVLLLGRGGVGKSLVANKILGLSDKNGGHEADRSGHHVQKHTSHNTVMMRIKSRLYELTVIDTHEIWDRQRSKLLTTSLKEYFQIISPANVNLILFIDRRDHFFGDERKSFFKCIMQHVRSPATSDISALVITHCDDLDGEARKATVDRLRKSQNSHDVANFMKKGIYTVGYCDVTDEDPEVRKRYEELMERDTNCLQQLISASSDTVSGYELWHGSASSDTLSGFDYYGSQCQLF